MSLKAFPCSILVATFLVSSCGGKEEPQGRSAVQVQEASASRQAAGPITFVADTGWEGVPTKSSMRLAQFRLPKAAGDAEDGELVLYFFGSLQGGDAQANLDRWIGQIEQPDGRASKDLAKVERWDQAELKLTLVDLTGTYVAETSPGSGERYNKPGFRLIATVAETPGGSVYFKATGPEKTIANWRESIGQMLRSVRGS